MARRATYFFDVHKADSPRILVSGGWEYMRPGGEVPSKPVLEALSKAYSKLKYDVGLLSKEEADILADNDVTIDNNRATAENTPFSIVTTENGDKIGFLRFPSFSSSDDKPSMELMKQVAKSIQGKRSEVKLIIAMSDWGKHGEELYLNTHPEDMPDMLFGSGSGGAVNGRIVADGRCFWVRPYDKGRTVSEIQIFAWPDRDKEFIWEEPANIKSLTTGLGDQYQDNPDVSKILQ